MFRICDHAAWTQTSFGLALAALLVVAGVPAGAQAPAPAPAEPDRPAAAAPAPRPADPGPFSAIGRVIDESLTGLTSGLKGARDSVDEVTGRAGEAAKGATTEAIRRLPPPPGVVAGREFCPLAANGAPDCRVASLALCRAKGFKEGRSIDMQTEQVCPPELWTAGRAPDESECRLESYVTRALCQ
jgi:hypothetical protein